MDIFNDNYCVITIDPESKRGLYADRYLNAQYMPIQWAYKIANYFKAGNYKQGYKLIDFIEIRWKRIQEVTT